MRKYSFVIIIIFNITMFLSLPSHAEIKSYSFSGNIQNVQDDGKIWGNDLTVGSTFSGYFYFDDATLVTGGTQNNNYANYLVNGQFAVEINGNNFYSSQISPLDLHLTNDMVSGNQYCDAIQIYARNIVSWPIAHYDQNMLVFSFATYSDTPPTMLNSQFYNSNINFNNLGQQYTIFNVETDTGPQLDKIANAYQVMYNPNYSVTPPDPTPEPSALQFVQFSQLAYGTSSVIPAGYTQVSLPSGACSNDGFCAKAYISAAGDKIILAFEGTKPTTSLQDWLADSTYINGGQPTDVLKAYMDEAVSDFVALKTLYTEANIEFTGHSLGGLIAQVMANETGLNATAFDSPGAQGLNFPNTPYNLQAYYEDNPSQQIINYRIYGDLVSTIGKQLPQTKIITFEAPIPQWQVDTFATGTALQMHSLSMMLERIYDNAPTTSEIGPTAQEEAVSLLSTVVKPNVSGVIQWGVNGVVAVDSLFYIDPHDANFYWLSSIDDGPNFQSVLFPYLYDIDAKFQLELFDNGFWKTIGLFDELEEYNFGPNGVDQFRFLILDSATMMPATSVEEFTLGVTFVADGDFHGTLVGYSVGEGAPVPEPTTILLFCTGLVGLFSIRKKTV